MQKDFRLKNLSMLETPRGITWTADIYYKNELVGDCYDDGANMVPMYGFANKKSEKAFEEWSNQFGMEEFKDIDLVASGLYALSEIYAEEVEGVTI